MSTVANVVDRLRDPSLVELTQTLQRGTDEAAVVTAEHLSKRFADLHAVDDLTFSLKSGTVTGFLGPNGAGKTTTLRMLLHLVEPSAGVRLYSAAVIRIWSGRQRKSGQCSRPRTSTRAAPGATTCSRSHSRSGAARRRQLVPRTRARRSEARGRGARSGRATQRRSPPRRQLLARDAPATRTCGRASGRPRLADPRRARQRA